MTAPVSAEALLPLVYEQLRALASKYLKRGADEPIAATSIVHEAFLKLRDAGAKDVQHFSALAATAMRQVLVDRARRRAAVKHGGGWQRVTLSVSIETGDDDAIDVVALDDALRKLEGLDARQARIVELRFFGGLTVPETADALGVSSSTVEKQWRRARAWLGAELSSGVNP